MKVIVYSTPTCPWCKVAKDFLKSHKIEFEDVDLSKETERVKEMVEKSGQTGVPVLDIDGEIVVGFDKVMIEYLLKIK